MSKTIYEAEVYTESNAFDSKKMWKHLDASSSLKEIKDRIREDNRSGFNSNIYRLVKWSDIYTKSYDPKMFYYVDKNTFKRISIETFYKKYEQKKKVEN